MTKVVEAIYTNGHLEPVEPLDLKENQRNAHPSDARIARSREA
ncbi:MAG: antitoxin family protein [Planctomycetes bacterium]|nr:antitoxin family protein [Planctomycetota bacterium]